ncbi:hypothetical protein GPECTOR_56g382 [Gonium pectorale]|uniref:SPOC domain-containing protein n=1 Tax=Gonium pectorale TaxID=33097 RepID=A0A150G5X2_GONPE|nr:hypothetical protein GPECTOR_56g382 [Gonium pectorale]|eukprot:KXZ45286.1 hypothetical protein GPECTOR_56g382 [Gonium pectorale]
MLGEEAYVVFASLRDAAICYEAIARACPFGGSRPLHVEFCSTFPPESPAARRRTAAMATGGGSAAAAAAALASQFIWVSSAAASGSAAAVGASAVTPEAVVAALQEAALPVPQQILQVQGRAPGMLLHMAAASAVPQLHESVRDEELLSACRAAGGQLVGHRFLRASHCAFVDFATQAGAEAAKRALHCMRMGPQHLRVEWKPPDGGAGAGAVPGPPPPPSLGARPSQPAATTWQGGLAKSGSHVCTLRCWGGGGSAAGGATPGEREPVGWPGVLDVKLRVDLTYVVHSLYSHTAPQVRAMRRLLPCNSSGGPADASAGPKLADFVSYLADKNRAGVIKLDASPAASLPPRTLYLVPPSEQVCAALGAEWTPLEPFLLALVVPAAGGA